MSLVLNIYDFLVQNAAKLRLEQDTNAVDRTAKIVVK